MFTLQNVRHRSFYKPLSTTAAFAAQILKTNKLRTFMKKSTLITFSSIGRSTSYSGTARILEALISWLTVSPKRYSNVSIAMQKYRQKRTLSVTIELAKKALKMHDGFALHDFIIVMITLKAF